MFPIIITTDGIKMLSVLYKPMGLKPASYMGECGTINRIINNNAHFQQPPIIPGGLRGLSSSSSSDRVLHSANTTFSTNNAHLRDVSISPLSGRRRAFRVANLPSPKPNEDPTQNSSSVGVMEGSDEEVTLGHATNGDSISALLLPKLSMFSKKEGEPGYKQIEFFNFYNRWIGNGVNPPMSQINTSGQGSDHQKAFSKFSIPCKKMDAGVKEYLEIKAKGQLDDETNLLQEARHAVMKSVQTEFNLSKTTFCYFVKHVMVKDWKVKFVIL